MSQESFWASGQVPSRGQLADEAADFVRERIVLGEIAPGTRVLAESVAQELGVSATPAREGLQTLRAEGFLTLAPRRGFVVAPLSEHDIVDVFTAVALLSGEQAARVARTATKEDLAPMREILDALQASAASGAAREAEYYGDQFYQELHALAKSRKIESFVKILIKYAPRGIYASTESWPASISADLERILTALESNDEHKARQAVIDQLMKSSELVADVFRRRSGSKQIHEPASSGPVGT